MLEDKEQDEPLLSRMCERGSRVPPVIACLVCCPCLTTSTRRCALAGSTFYQALALFRRRSIYANVRSDLQVPFSTAAIMPYNPFISRIKYVPPSSPSHAILFSRRTLDSTLIGFIFTAWQGTAGV